MKTKNTQDFKKIYDEQECWDILVFGHTMKPYQAIIKNIQEHPEDWQVGQYIFENNKKQLAIWIANGIFFVEEKQSRTPISLFGKIKIWNAFKRWQTNRILL